MSGGFCFGRGKDICSPSREPFPGSIIHDKRKLLGVSGGSFFGLRKKGFWQSREILTDYLSPNVNSLHLFSCPEQLNR